jgi:hypothetical protein
MLAFAALTWAVWRAVYAPGASRFIVFKGQSSHAPQRLHDEVSADSSACPRGRSRPEYREN